MQYLTKNFRKLFNALPNMDCTYEKPAQCPHCEICCDPLIVGQELLSPFSPNPSSFVFLVFQCTACKKLFTATYEVANKKSRLCCMTPFKPLVFVDELIEKTSPRFIEVYNQAIRAKENGDLNLAAVGYRSALEILIKDYAINDLHEPSEKVVKLDLFHAISNYLSSDTVNAADVVRILGNDHTHYERKYPELDFKVLQEYMDIFIHSIRVKLLISNPPVSRQ